MRRVANGEGSWWRGRERPGERMDALREEFLAEPGRPVPGVRDLIAASWRRAVDHRVDADEVHPSFFADLDDQGLLARSSRPVLAQLAEQLADDPLGILLTDAQGRVIERLSHDRTLTAGLDKVQLAPGFSYAEGSVGTNGIGTALECRGPVLVQGFEHFAGGLVEFECAGAPIFHPLHGGVVGVLDLTTFSGDSGRLLLTLAKSTARRIEQEMLSKAGTRELALLREYLAACRRGNGVVLALSDDVLMLSTQAQERYDLGDRAALIGRTADAAGSREPATLIAELPSGLVARLEYQPVFSGGRLAGGVFRVREQATPPPPRRPPSPRVTSRGLVGSSAIWQHACAEVDRGIAAGEWIALEGEAGAGKASLLRASALRSTPSVSPYVADCRAAGADEELDAWIAELDVLVSDGCRALVLAHLDELPAEGVQALADLFTEWQAAGFGAAPWVGVTLRGGPRSADLDAWLLPFFPHTVEVPPLRHRVADLAEIVPHLLARHARGRELTCSPACLRQLMRLPWPGNLRELDRVLAQVVQTRRGGIVEVDDLPPECRAVTRRQLSQLESIERDAIVRSLDVNGGNKERAAADLGMSRATIYRKIRAFGIAPPPSTP